MANESAKRYRTEELSDSDGNVIYPHTESEVVWMKDGQSLSSYMSGEVTDEQINSILNS